MQGRPLGLLKATLTLLAGGALAQALPLLLGPWLTRLYSPEEFGHYMRDDIEKWAKIVKISGAKVD